MLLQALLIIAFTNLWPRERTPRFNFTAGESDQVKTVSRNRPIAVPRPKTRAGPKHQTQQNDSDSDDGSITQVRKDQ